MKLIS